MWYLYLVAPSAEALEQYRRWHVGERQHVWFPEFAALLTRCVVVRAGELVLLPAG